MRRVYEEEWTEMMDKAIKENDLSNIKFLWTQFKTVKAYGYFVLPF